MGAINDLAAIAVKKMETNAAIKEAKIKERSQVRELKAKKQEHVRNIKSQEWESRLREKEETKRVRSESRSAVAHTAINSSTGMLTDIGKGAMDNVGTILKDKDINVHVPGTCKVSIKGTTIDGEGSYLEEATPLLEDGQIDCIEGSTSSVFSN